MRLVLVSDHATVSGGASAVALASADGLRARGLAISGGATVTYNAASFLVDDIRRQRFTGSGTFDGANLICPGSANLTPGDTDIYTVYTPNGTTAYVSAGSNN